MRATTERAVADTVLKWLAANYGRAALAPLTGTDWRALRAFVQTLELLVYSPDPGVYIALGHIALKMQRSTRWIAKASIPQTYDWEAERYIWHMIAESAIEVVEREELHAVVRRVQRKGGDG